MRCHQPQQPGRGRRNYVHARTARTLILTLLAFSGLDSRVRTLPQYLLLNLGLCKRNGQSHLSFDGPNGPVTRYYARMEFKDLIVWLMMRIRHVYNDCLTMIYVHRESTKHLHQSTYAGCMFYHLTTITSSVAIDLAAPMKDEDPLAHQRVKDL